MVKLTGVLLRVWILLVTRVHWDTSVSAWDFKDYRYSSVVRWSHHPWLFQSHIHIS